MPVRTRLRSRRRRRAWHPRSPADRARGRVRRPPAAQPSPAPPVARSMRPGASPPRNARPPRRAAARTASRCRSPRARRSGYRPRPPAQPRAATDGRDRDPVPGPAARCASPPARRADRRSDETRRVPNVRRTLLRERLLDRLLQACPGRELRHPRRRYLDSLSGGRIAALARGALGDAELPEAREHDLASTLECVFDRLQHRVDRIRGILLAQPGAIRNLVDEL